MNSSESDERFPVWDVLSEFFLDTGLDDKDYERISDVLSKSEYSIKEIEGILYYEVYPECIGNLFCIAGEWAGFHPDWIMERIAPRKNKRPKITLGPLLKWFFNRHWFEVSKRIKEKRKIR